MTAENVKTQERGDASMTEGAIRKTANGKGFALLFE